MQDTDNNSFIHSSLDYLSFIFISGVIIELYSLWIIVNIIKTNNIFIWLTTIPLSLFFSYILTKNYTFSLHKLSNKLIIPWILFSILSLSVGLYYLEPTMRYPFSSIGIPFKDMHDAMTVYIHDYGYPPIKSADPSGTKFITNSFFTSQQSYYQNLYKGYPNVLHVFSALLIKLRVFEFHTTWIAFAIMIVVDSLTLFLVLKYLYKDQYFAAIVAGLFGITSFRIAYSLVASLVMAFSLTLLLPVIFVVIASLKNYKNSLSYLLPVLSITLLAAAFTSTTEVFFGFISIYLFLLVVFRKKNEVIHLLKIISIFILTIPLLFVILTLRHTTYFANVFHLLPTTIDFDPNELSQWIVPFDKPIYMLFYIGSVIYCIYSIVKHRLSIKNNVIKIWVLLINVVLWIPIIFDFFFQLTWKTNTAVALQHIPATGIFGGLNNFLFHRLALVQPFFFVIILGDIFLLIKNRILRYALLITVILLNFVVRLDVPLYQVIRPELQTSFYNKVDRNKPYTLLSHIRIVVNDQIWTPGLIKVFKFLKLNGNHYGRILVLDERVWPEESVVNWGSLYLRKKLYRPEEFGITYPSLQYDGMTNLLKNVDTILFVNSQGSTRSVFSTIPSLKAINFDDSDILYIKKAP